MPDRDALLLFISAGLLLNLTPGPDVLYIVGRSLSQGRVPGVVSALGIGAGCLVHVAAGTLSRPRSPATTERWRRQPTRSRS